MQMLNDICIKFKSCNVWKDIIMFCMRLAIRFCFVILF